jgi:hypothetical protein
MLDNSHKSNRTLNEILESLLVKEETYDTFYQTRSREDYDRFSMRLLPEILKV